VFESRGLALGIVYAGTNLAGFLGLPLAAWVSSSYGWRSAVMAVAGSAAALILPAALFVVRDPRPGEVAAAAPAVAGDAQALPGRDLDLGAAVATRSFWLLAFVLFAFFFYFIAMIEHTVAYLTDIGFSKVEAAGGFGFALGLGVWSKLGAGFLSDRVPSRTAMAVDYAVMTASSILVFFVGSPGLLTVFLVAYGVSVAARDVVYPMIVAECFGVAYLARIYGALMLALLPGGAFGPIFAAWVFDRYGDYGPAFAVFAAVNLVALAAILSLRDERGGGGVRAVSNLTASAGARRAP
jgi:predicted MFS family arabinose efflux permease